MQSFLFAWLLGLAVCATACTETITETKTITLHDTVIRTVHDTVTIREAIEREGTTVIVVRHAEKADNSADPVLSPDGELRAQELARLFWNVKLNKIYTTPFNRTRLTAAPIAELNGVTPAEYAPNTTAVQLAERILLENTGKIALVVGHSNTVPELLKALSGNSFVVQIQDSQYDDLFIANVHAKEPEILHMKYGKPTP